MMTLLPMMASAVSGVVLMPLAMRAHQDAQREFRGPQVIHQRPTSRLGGAIVVVAYTCALVVILTIEHSARRPGLALLLCALPVVGVGVVEDLTYRVSPWVRLQAALVSAALATAVLGATVTRVEVPIVDALLAFTPFAAVATWIMVAGLCSAMNIIDGSHGLAGGTALLMFTGLGVVAGAVDDHLLLASALAMAGALVGFLLWNYPRGRVFLGDAGAYFLGFMYAQLSILLVIRHPQVSPWLPLVLAAYPVTETLYSIYRRRVLTHSSTTTPDLMHLHSLVYRRLRRVSPGMRTPARTTCNARVAPRLWLQTAVCVIAGTSFYDDTPVLMSIATLYVAAYVLFYRRLLESCAVLRVSRVYGAAGAD